MRRRSFFDPIPNKGRSKRTRRSDSKSVPFAAKILGASAAFGAVIGIGSIATADGGPQRIASAARSLAVGTGIVRKRSPQAGDYWARCDSARAAGTAPIYRGEPGYRSGLDGDSDGIACEPYHGN